MQLSKEELLKILPNARLDGRQRNLYTICPKCQHDEFGVSLSDNHRFGCFRKSQCGFNGNIFSLAAFLGIRLSDIRSSFEFKEKIDISKMLITEEHKIDLELPTCNPPIGWRRIYDNEYLNSRGFTEADYHKYKVGTTRLQEKYKGYVIFLIEQYDEVKATIGRSNLKKEQIEALNERYKTQGLKKKALRYVNSSSDFAKILLGLDELTEKTDTVIVVEGLFDKINTDKKLQLAEQEYVKCCATFKCGCSEEQIFLMQQYGIKNVILLYDPDVINDIKKAGCDLENYFEVQIGFAENGKDPGDMEEEDFDTVFDNLKSPSQFNSSKVAVPKLKKR